MRLLNSVEATLVTAIPSWNVFADPLDADLLRVLLEWAWSQPGFEQAARAAFRVDDEADIRPLRGQFKELVSKWLTGARFEEIAVHVQMDIDDVLGVHTGLLTFEFQTLVEQGIALLARSLKAGEQELAAAVVAFPEYLRFGVPSAAALSLATRIRHRRAAVELGALLAVDDGDWRTVFAEARRRIGAEDWRQRLGNLVLENTKADLNSILGTDEFPGQ
jgi:hypothetical protein